jgi:hypothetical protein
VSFAAITLCVASQRVFIVIVYFFIDPVQKILDAPSYNKIIKCLHFKKLFFSSPPRPEWLWGQTSLLSNGYQGLFPWGQSGRGVDLTTPI